MPTVYDDPWAGFARGVSGGLDTVAKERAERKKTAAESKQKERELLIKEAGYQPVVGPDMSITSLKPPQDFSAPEGYEYARDRPGHKLVYSGGMGGFQPGPQPGVDGPLPELESVTYGKSGPRSTYKMPPRLTGEQLTHLKGAEDYFSKLERVKTLWDQQKQTTGKQFETGPMAGRYYKGLPGNLIMQTKGTPQEADFKGAITDLQAAKAKFESGAARGFKEIEWLQPTLPFPQERPDIFKYRLNEAVKAGQKNKDRVKQFYQQQGYRPPKEVGQQSGGQIMIDANGNKAMVYPDGSYDEVP